MLAARAWRKTKVPTKNRLMQNHRQLPHWMSSRTSRAARAGRVSQHAGAGSSEFAHSASRHERRSTHKKSFAPDPFSTTSHLPNEPGPIPRPYRDRALRWDTQSAVSVFWRLRSNKIQNSAPCRPWVYCRVSCRQVLLNMASCCLGTCFLSGFLSGFLRPAALPGDMSAYACQVSCWG